MGTKKLKFEIVKYCFFTQVQVISVMAESQASSPSDVHLDFDDDTLKSKN